MGSVELVLCAKGFVKVVMRRSVVASTVCAPSGFKRTWKEGILHVINPREWMEFNDVCN